MSQKTTLPKVDEIQKNWWIVDASGQILGRVASQVATLLIGKHKPFFTPHLEVGDNVIIVNAEKITVKGTRKLDSKIYYRHSQVMGHLKEETLRRMLLRRPERVLQLAVRRMLPKTPNGRRMLGRLKVYVGPEHPHTAQKPQEFKLRDRI